MRFIIFLLLLLSVKCFAQQANQLTAIGQWREHLPYIQTTRLSATGDMVYCATPYSFFGYNTTDNSIERFSRMTGLAETGLSMMLYDESSENLVVAYFNSNIDIISSNKIRNVPDIKISNVSGDKMVYNIFFRNNFAYLSSGVGVIVLDMDRAEVKDTYFIGTGGSQVKVNGFTCDNNFFYAATTDGLKRAAVNSSNLANYANWSNISGSNGLQAGAVDDVFFTQNKLFAVRADTIFQWNGTSWVSFFTQSPLTITRVHAANNRIAVCLINRVVFLNIDGTEDRTFPTNIDNVVLPQDAIFFKGSYYIADYYVGLTKFSGTSSEKILPNSPFSVASGDVIADGKQIWVASGAVNEAWNYTYNRSGIYHLDDENKWHTYSQLTGIQGWDTVMDFITAAVDQRSGSLFAGSFGGGLVELRADRSYKIFKQGTGLQQTVGDPNSYRVSGLAFDQNNNLWISNFGAPNALVLRKADSSWRSFNIPFFLNENTVSQIIVDDYDQKWIVSPKGNGLICYNHGANIDDPADDRWRMYRAGSSNGNLPDNNVFCVAKDKDGFIWVGTSKGIAVIGCADNVFSSSCNAVLPIVKQGAFAGYLFSGEEVRSIVVDGGNRKWVGTKNGLWLISPDGEKVIERFTEDNSPLLSNDVKKLTINPVTGELFVLTFKGICSFRGTATEGSTQNENVLVFPNPVPPTFKGTIAIKGVVSNAIVKITELDGRLVYQTRAFGGQATWNGKNYRGQDVSSGVYLVLIADETNQEKAVAKIVMIR
jgi:hypothetical protein